MDAIQAQIAAEKKARSVRRVEIIGEAHRIAMTASGMHRAERSNAYDELAGMLAGLATEVMDWEVPRERPVEEIPGLLIIEGLMVLLEFEDERAAAGFRRVTRMEVLMTRHRNGQIGPSRESMCAAEARRLIVSAERDVTAALEQRRGVCRDKDTNPVRTPDGRLAMANERLAELHRDFLVELAVGEGLVVPPVGV